MLCTSSWPPSPKDLLASVEFLISSLLDPVQNSVNVGYGAGSEKVMYFLSLLEALLPRTREMMAGGGGMWEGAGKTKEQRLH